MFGKTGQDLINKDVLGGGYFLQRKNDIYYNDRYVGILYFFLLNDR